MILLKSRRNINRTRLWKAKSYPWTGNIWYNTSPYSSCKACPGWRTHENASSLSLASSCLKLQISGNTVNILHEPFSQNLVKDWTVTLIWLRRLVSFKRPSLTTSTSFQTMRFSSHTRSWSSVASSISILVALCSTTESLDSVLWKGSVSNSHTVQWVQHQITWQVNVYLNSCGVGFQVPWLTLTQATEALMHF